MKTKMKKTYVLIGVVLVMIFSGCVQEPRVEECKDSDSRLNYYTAGCADFLVDGIITEHSCDICFDDQRLNEISCFDKSGGQYIGVAQYLCPYGCENGACKAGPTTTMPSVMENES